MKTKITPIEETGNTFKKIGIEVLLHDIFAYAVVCIIVLSIFIF